MEILKASRGLAFLRIVLGLLLIWHVLPNLDHSFIEQLPEQIDAITEHNPYPFYRWIVHNLIMPNTEQIGIIIPVGQLLIGSALVIGFLVRLTSFLGIFYTTNLLIASGHISIFHQSSAILLTLIFATLIISDAGKYYGSDGFLFKDKNNPSEKSVKPKFKNKKQKEVVDALSKQVKSGKKKKTKTSS